jgi:shikimate kinase
MNIVLVGYRGTGKTAAASLLGARRGWPVVHLDAEIVRRAGRSIPDIVADVGWPGFRDLEEEVVRSCARGDSCVLDCGGGVVEREANVPILRGTGPVVWLRASVATIVRRIADDSQRPSLTGAKSFTDEVAQVLARRTPLYQRIAHCHVDTDARTIEEVVAEIEQLLSDFSPMA